MLEEAAEWMGLAERDAGSAEAFVADGPVFPNEQAAGPWSIYFGEAGVWFVSALVHNGVHDADATADAIARFCELAASCPADALDAATGAASLLLGASVLVEQLPLPLHERVKPVGDSLARRLVDRASHRQGPGFDAIRWLGAAHGWCGIAHAQLRWCQATGTSPSSSLLALLDSLRDARLARGVWPRADDAADVWPGWCHGSAGWALLWCLAADVLRDDELLELAEPPAVHALLDRSAGSSLCCGLAGQAYAGLTMYKATAETTWLVHARRLADVARRTPVGPDFPAHSLWGGDLGVALLNIELEDPARAAMPAYQAIA